MHRREQDALQDSEQQHGHQRNRRGVEVDPADSPHPHQRPDVDQPIDGGKDDGCQHRLGQVRQQPREEKQAQRERHRANTSASGVRAPALSLTADCDKPPATG